MDAERIARAQARIEAAAKRIATASRAARSAPSAPASPAPSAVPAAQSDLARRHEQLRKQASAALAELDRLIESIEA